MKDVCVMKDLDQIKCISQPYRLQIIEAFSNEPGTAKMVSERMGEPHAKINYHIKEMQKHGILELVEEVVRMGVVEKFYQPVAKRFVVQSTSLKLTEKEAMDSLNQYRITIFDACSKAFYHALEHITPESFFKSSLASECYLTRQEAEAFQTQLRALVETYLEIGDVKRDGTEAFTIANFMIPEEK